MCPQGYIVSWGHMGWKWLKSGHLTQNAPCYKLTKSYSHGPLHLQAPVFELVALKNPLVPPQISSAALVTKPKNLATQDDQKNRIYWMIEWGNEHDVIWQGIQGCQEDQRSLEPKLLQHKINEIYVYIHESTLPRILEESSTFFSRIGDSISPKAKGEIEIQYSDIAPHYKYQNQRLYLEVTENLKVQFRSLDTLKREA